MFAFGPCMRRMADVGALSVSGNVFCQKDSTGRGAAQWGLIEMGPGKKILVLHFIQSLGLQDQAIPIYFSEATAGKGEICIHAL